MLKYSLAKISAVLEEIRRLEESEFPHACSQKALQEVKSAFDINLSSLQLLLNNPDTTLIKKACETALTWLFVYTPVLGYILRSTNVRNAFELFNPFLKICRAILEPNIPENKRKTLLVLSSEWNYSPITRVNVKGLPDVVIIGLPAPESSNPLLAPLFGHELGHTVWNQFKIEGAISKDIKNAIFKNILADLTTLRQLFPSTSIKNEIDLESSLFGAPIWKPISDFVLEQAQESFCDFLGLKIFGDSYLRAYCYLLAPRLTGYRPVQYPNVITRVQNIIQAAKTYKYEIPQNYIDNFEDRVVPPLSETDKFRLKTADSVLPQFIDSLITKANEIVLNSKIPLSTKSEVDKIYHQFENVVPAPKVVCLADILNAGWKAYENESLWLNKEHIQKRKDLVLKELILKNVEIFEIEQRLK